MGGRSTRARREDVARADGGCPSCMQVLWGVRNLNGFHKRQAAAIAEATRGLSRLRVLELTFYYPKVVSRVASQLPDVQVRIVASQATLILSPHHQIRSVQSPLFPGNFASVRCILETGNAAQLLDSSSPRTQSMDLRPKPSSHRQVLGTPMRSVGGFRVNGTRQNAGLSKELRIESRDKAHVQLARTAPVVITPLLRRLMPRDPSGCLKLKLLSCP